MQWSASIAAEPHRPVIRTMLFLLGIGGKQEGKPSLYRLSFRHC
jgi:hypothetical protein